MERRTNGRGCCLSIVCALGALVFSNSVDGQVAPCCCYVLEKTAACYIDGMGVNCGTYSCPHLILANETLYQCRGTENGEKGQENCVPNTQLLAALCDMRLCACSPTLGCVHSGIVHAIYHIHEVPSGMSCN